MKNKAKATIEKFLQAWKDYDIDKMYDLSQQTWKFQYSKKVFKGFFQSRIKAFTINEIREFTPTVFDLDITIRVKGQQRKITARLICETSPYTPSVDGEFGVNPISVIKNLY